MTRRKEKTKVIRSSYLVKIIGTHLETIKDGDIVFGQFSRLLVILTKLPFYILDKEKMEANFSESSCIKNKRTKAKLLSTDISHGCLYFGNQSFNNQKEFLGTQASS